MDQAIYDNPDGLWHVLSIQVQNVLIACASVNDVWTDENTKVYTKSFKNKFDHLYQRL